MNLLTWPNAQATGPGLETDMRPKQTGGADDDAGPNTNLAVAPYGAPPHPANEAFPECMAAALMKTLGMHLSSITTRENFPWAAVQIRDYVADHFGEQFVLPDMPNVPKRLVPPEQPVDPAIVPAAFRYRLGSLELATLDQECAVGRNLDWSKCFTSILPKAKALLRTNIAVRLLSPVIEGVMSELQLCDERQA